MSDQDFDSTQKNLWFDPEKARLFGSMLTSAREVSGLSIERLAETTRISLPFLKCLESGDFSGLPGAVFGRGFLRSICKAINADSADVLAAFDQAVKVGSQANAKSLNVAVETGASNVRLRSELSFDHPAIRGLRFAASQIGRIPFGVIGAAVLAAGVIPGVLWILGKPSTQKQAAETTHKSAETADVRLPGAIPVEAIEAATQTEDVAVGAAQEAASEATQPVADQPSTTAAEATTETAKAATTAEAPATQKVESISVAAEAAKPSSDAVTQSNPERQKLDVNVQASVKLRINLDGGAWDSKQLEPGSYTFEFDKTAQILVFDAAAVDVKFNGKPLGALGAKGRVRRLSFAAQRTGNLEVPKRL